MNIIKSETEIELKGFFIKTDIENKTLTISIPKDFKINVIGNIDFQIKGDFNIETDGEINLLSNNKDINLESLGAKIFLNSYRAKQIRNKRHYRKLRHKELSKISKEKTTPHRHPLDDVIDAISSLNERITKLEGLGNTININSIEIKNED